VSIIPFQLVIPSLSQISEEDFQTLLDRVATTRDVAVVRDSIIYFLQRYLATLSMQDIAAAAGMEDRGDAKEIERKVLSRRKTALRTMEAMSVLDMSMGLAEEEESRSKRARGRDDEDEDDLYLDGDWDRAASAKTPRRDSSRKSRKGRK
jgi:hypothetical protein